MLLQLCKNCLVIEQMVELKIDTYDTTCKEVIKLQNEILNSFSNYNSNCVKKIKLIRADVEERLHSFNYCLQQFSKFSGNSETRSVHQSNFLNLIENYRERLKLSLDVFHREAKSTIENLENQTLKLTEVNRRLTEICETLKNECFENEKKNFEVSQQYLKEFKAIKRNNEKQVEIINEKMKTAIKQGVKEDLDKLTKSPKEQIVRGEQTLTLLQNNKVQILGKIKNFKVNEEEKNETSELKNEVLRAHRNVEKLKRRFCLDFEGFQSDLKSLIKNIESFEKSLK